MTKMNAYKQIPFYNTKLSRGYWKNRQDIASSVSIFSVYDRFEETGRFEALKFEWKPGMPNEPHIFWESDAAKWIESAAYMLETKYDERLVEKCDALIDLMEEHQEENGYFNIHFTVVEPDQRFKKRTDHELYCAGHLMEAACAYYHATGKRKLLDVMEKYAELIDKVFCKEQSAAFLTPGHEEIELALVKMYNVTKKERYLEMASWFIEQRGRQIEDTYGSVTPEYHQSHLPVREQKTAEGHSVRAMYLYMAMADLAYEKNDKTLFDACVTLLKNVAEKRMYITGGIGSARQGEAFTVDYDLQNITAYTETCAALALALFARRMSLISPEGWFADVAERALYNGMMSGISMDGKSFFYENPLEIHPYLLTRHVSQKRQEELPITQRLEVFSCSCCPPNITRVIASIADFMYTYGEDTLFVHHYMDGVTDFEGHKIVMKTDYPACGKVEIAANGFAKRMALRIPLWCRRFTLTVNGKNADYELRSGYAYIAIEKDDVVSLDMVMEAKWVEANRKVFDSAQKVALYRGPVVYCAEAVDNGEDLCDVLVDPRAEIKLTEGEFGLNDLLVTAYRRSDFDALYRDYECDRQETTLRFIPYYAFANRGESEMLVWFKHC